MRDRILAVDDDPAQLELVDLLLKEEGFAVDTAADGIEALQKVQRSRPDLIVLDASMPRMNGFTFCEKVRQDAATARIPIIMVTGLRNDFSRLNGFAHGANAYLAKPYVAAELLAKINELLAAARTGKGG